MINKIRLDFNSNLDLEPGMHAQELVGSRYYTSNIKGTIPSSRPRKFEFF